jgi:hypothetical protein
VITVLLIMLGFTFLTGYGYVWVFFDEYSNEEKLALSGMMGLAQILFIYFLVKTFMIFTTSVITVVILDVVLVAYKWLRKRDKNRTQ